MSVQCTDNGLCPILDVQCHLDLYSVHELSLLCVTYIFNITQTMLYYEIKAVSKICKTRTIPRKLCTSLDLVCVKVNSVRLSHALISPLTILRASGGTQLTCGVWSGTSSGSVSPVGESECTSSSSNMGGSISTGSGSVSQIGV